MRLHPLTYRILGSLGLGAMAVPGASACDSETSDFGCPDVTSREEEPVPGCVITLTSEESAAQFCTSIRLIDGQCPPFSEPDVQSAVEANNREVVCGPVAGQQANGGEGIGGGGGVGGGGVGGGGVGGEGQGGGVGGAGGGGQGQGGEPAIMGDCCYIAIDGQYCIGGRPFYVGGELRTASVVARDDWRNLFAPCADLDPAARAALSEAWLADAALEHASVASFARFALELLAVGAPPELLVDTQRAMLDEIGHARACFGLASRYAQRDLGPAPLSLDGVVPETSLLEVVRSTVKEGCIGETVAALVAARALSGATDAAVREVLTAIADEEARHAELAWKFVAWAVREGGQPVRDVVQKAIDAALAPVLVGDDAVAEASAEVLGAHGRLTKRQERAVIAEALEHVVRPCARAVLDASHGVDHSLGMSSGRCSTSGVLPPSTGFLCHQRQREVS